MNAGKAILKWGINIPVNFDKLVAWATKNKPWGKYQKGKTISWGFGAEEAEIIYLEYLEHHRILGDLPYISLKYPLGQFSEDICSAIQSIGSGRKRFHGLECFINNPGPLAVKYPDIVPVVKTYLRKQGVEVT